ncbi:MAG: DUF3795 domain-containing protein [Chloroflexota bacterium]
MIKLSRELVAPCGMNCGVCKRYLATVRGLAGGKGMPACTGCRPQNRKCALIIRGCRLLSGKKINFCFECPDFPCARLERLNHRYTTRYHTDLVENLLAIKELGLNRWLKKQAGKWQCPQCGGTISIHDRRCYDCGYASG